MTDVLIDCGSNKVVDLTSILAKIYGNYQPKRIYALIKEDAIVAQTVDMRERQRRCSVQCLVVPEAFKNNAVSRLAYYQGRMKGEADYSPMGGLIRKVSETLDNNPIPMMLGIAGTVDFFLKSNNAGQLLIFTDEDAVRNLSPDDALWRAYNSTTIYDLGCQVVATYVRPVSTASES
jgi:hypothetical protein